MKEITKRENFKKGNREKKVCMCVCVCMCMQNIEDKPKVQKSTNAHPLHPLLPQFTAKIVFLPQTVKAKLKADKNQRQHCVLAQE